MGRDREAANAQCQGDRASGKRDDRIQERLNTLFVSKATSKVEQTWPKDREMVNIHVPHERASCLCYCCGGVGRQEPPFPCALLIKVLHYVIRKVERTFDFTRYLWKGFRTILNEGEKECAWAYVALYSSSTLTQKEVSVPCLGGTKKRDRDI